MNTDQLIAYCRQQGIKFFLGNSTIRVHGTCSAIEKILPILQANKKEIFEYLSKMTFDDSNNFIYEDNLIHSEKDAKKALEETRSLFNRIMSRHVR